VPPRAVPRETAAEAIHVLDAQFPWLAGAEQPVSRKPAWHPRSPPPDVSKQDHPILNTGLDHTARPQQAAQEIAKPAERHNAAPSKATRRESFADASHESGHVRNREADAVEILGLPSECLKLRPAAFPASIQ